VQPFISPNTVGKMVPLGRSRGRKALSILGDTSKKGRGFVTRHRKGKSRFRSPRRLEGKGRSPQLEKGNEGYNPGGISRKKEGFRFPSERKKKKAPG